MRRIEVHAVDHLAVGEGLQPAQPEHTRPTLDVRTQADPAGLRLATVYELGPAHRAGLSAGDLLIAADGLRIADAAGLDRLLDARRPGERLALHVFRRDELRQYTVRLGKPAALRHQLKRVAPAVPARDAAESA